MAEVWRAKLFGADGFERIVAIKRILPNVALTPEVTRMFIDEANLTVTLNHANIAKVDELNIVSNSHYIAMEYVSGKDLRAIFEWHRARNERAPLSLVCYILSSCCDALDYAHRVKSGTGAQLRVIHRDVSPQNVLVSYEGEVKIIDFGIAKVAGKMSRTQVGIIKGKYSYMSPEQARSATIDRRTDIFALGICLHEMLTGRRLFVANSDPEILEMVRRCQVPLPSSINPLVPPALDAIVMKALAREPDDRYRWASDMAQDLLRFMYSTGEPGSRAELAQFMKRAFATDYETERTRFAEYEAIRPPPQLASALSPKMSAPSLAPPSVASFSEPRREGLGTRGPAPRSNIGNAANDEATLRVPSEETNIFGVAPRRRKPQQPAKPSTSSVPAPSYRKSGIIRADTTPTSQTIMATAADMALPAAPLELANASDKQSFEDDETDRPPRRRALAPLKIALVVLALAVAGAVAYRATRAPQAVLTVDVPPAARSTARLFLDDAFAGNTWPRLVYRREGTVRLRITATGYDPFETIVELNADSPASVVAPLRARSLSQ